MKKFLINILIFSSLIFVSIYFVLSQADGYSDAFYLKFTTPKQNSLIIGTSKSAQGLLPAVFNEKLDIEIYNYSFTIDGSPYGPTYLKSIKRKLSKNNKNGVFILSVDCWSIISKCDDPNDTLSFRENNSHIAEMKTVDKNPNFSYLLKYMMGNYYKIIHKPSVALLHNDGWLDVSLATDSISVNRRTKTTLANYNKSRDNDLYSSLRLDYLIKTIDFLNAYGDVYLVRLPVIPELMILEENVMPDFNKKMKKAATNAAGYLDLTIYNDLYEYTDGVHLQKESGKKVSEEIANWIKSIENSQP